MSVTTKNEGGVCVLKVIAEFTGHNVEKFREFARQRLADDVRDFVVDMSETTSIDSEGLEALTWLRRESEDELGMVKLCRVPDTIKEILVITRLSHQFEQTDRIDQALASFS